MNQQNSQSKTPNISNDMRRIERRYEYNDALVEAVKAGNASIAIDCIRGISVDLPMMVRNANPLRNMQNMCIVLNTQLRVALSDTGIHPYRLDQLSSEIALRIEKFKTVLEAERFFETILQKYCDLANEDKYAHIERLSRLAISYIKEHLSENLTVKEVANVLALNADYLSNRFHKEVGIPFIQFVNRERSIQAARLLRETDMQIQHISETVGFNHTSYFAKQFATFFGVTPSQYRQNPTKLKTP